MLVFIWIEHNEDTFITRFYIHFIICDYEHLAIRVLFGLLMFLFFLIAAASKG